MVLPGGPALKILHIVENLHRGAVETWLVRMFEESRAFRPADEWTFYCALGEPGRHDEHVRKLGGRIIYSPVPFRRTVSFLWALRKTLKDEHFDIMHCHHDLLSGFYLLAALGLPIRQRIVHVHNTDEALPTPNWFKHWVLKEPLRKTCFGLSARVVGISKHTLATFLHGRKPRAGRDEVLYYGCDFSACVGERLDPALLKNNLGFPSDMRIVLFIGRLDPIKNPIGALNIFGALYRRRNDVACLFAGEGDLADGILEQAKRLGVSNRVRLLGWHETPSALMQACDLFLFPRLQNNVEGFGFSVLEAQAAGLPVLTSYGVSDEVLVFPERCRQIPITESPEVWAAAADELLKTTRPSHQDILLALQDTPFSKETGARNLLALYESSVADVAIEWQPTS